MSDFVKAECFVKEWIVNKQKEYLADPTLIEKVIYAFNLLGFLVKSEIPFIFKGGTSLLLHIPKIKRLSIDIDIITRDIEKLEKSFNFIENSFFIRFEEDKRENQGLPNRKHFKFFYNSIISLREDYVLLDVVLENPSYLKFTEDKIIKNVFFETNEDLLVTVPTIEGLLGDKLTAFAPHTIGVPFKTNNDNDMSMQVAKQLFDIGELFNFASNFENIQFAFETAFEKENGYREKEYSKEDVLKDTINTCLTLIRINLKSYKDDAVTMPLKLGIKKLESHLVNTQFRVMSEAKISASKVFCVANKILHSKRFDFKTEKFIQSDLEQIKNIKLEKPYEKLNPLKLILPEVFYYIWKGLQ